MPALRKPYRVAFLLPDVSIDGLDSAHEAEAALVLWLACIEACGRHPELAVYDPESTPLQPQDGHFAPRHAQLGATPTDTFYAQARRDELAWLELGLPRGAVRLRTISRAGKAESFDAIGRTLGEQLQQVLGAWLAARGLGPLPRRLEPVTGEELVALARVLGPPLAEQARAWTPPLAPSPEDEPAGDEDGAVGDEDSALHEIDAALDRLGGDEGLGGATLDTPIDTPLETTLRDETQVPGPLRRLGRGLANRLPKVLRVPALRVLELALREPLTEQILAIDPEHPQALFARYLARPDPALLRRVIAAAPGWARAYGELGALEGELAPTHLEAIAGAGIAALCRPAQWSIIDVAATRLADDGRVDEAVRIMARATRLHERESQAHLALARLHGLTDRVGGWLEQTHRSAALHGCPMEPTLPWYPDQIQIDLAVADALLGAGRLDEAIALRANRLEGREATWPRHTRILASWRKDPRFVAWCFAREGYFRGDPARAVEGFGRIEPADSLDLAILLDSLVAVGREDEVALAWAHFGLGLGHDGPVARLAAARGLLAAGEWRRGLEELWRVELREPGRDEQVALAHCGRALAAMPLEVAETLLAERMAIGASSLARRMARDIADFVPGAAKSSLVMRALGKPTEVEFDPASLAGFGAGIPGKAAIDALFVEEPEGSEHRSAMLERRAARRGTKVDRPAAPPADPLALADRLVVRWLEVVFTGASEDDRPGLARAAAYVAAQALGRYLALTTSAPTPLAGGLRTVAAEALALVRRYQDALPDREARALLAMLDHPGAPLLRRVDRWLGYEWLGALERACAIDERAGGDVAGFVRDAGTVAARILGPEEAAVLAMSVARLCRDQPEGWHSAVASQAARLALHTGHTGVAEWAAATVAQLAARAIELPDALDALHTACYLAEGRTAAPAIEAAGVLFGAGRAPAAVAVLTTGFAAASDAERARALDPQGAIAPAWQAAKLDVPLAFDKVATGMFEALQQGEPARAEKLGRWAVAYDPDNAEAHRNLGLALAQQGKLVDALGHLVRGTREQATQILSGVLYQTGKLAEAMAVLDYASRWYVRADQWLTYGGIAYAAMDNPRTAKAYALAYQLDPDAFDATQLNAYAGVLDEVGDYVTCERIANHLLRVAGDDVVWKTNAWNHLACGYIGQGRFDEALPLAQQAVDANPLPDNAAGFAATLERAKTRTQSTPPPLPPIRAREPVFALLEAGDFATAAALLGEPGWRGRRGALAAARFRFAPENAVEVTGRARAAAARVLVESAGATDRDAATCRALALAIREAAFFPRDPVPRLGDRMTRDAFYREFRARGGIVLGEVAPPPPAFEDKVVVPGSKVARTSDYVALLRDLAALTPREALAQFDLDDAGYLVVAQEWAAAMERDPSIASTIAAGLARGGMR